MTTNADVLHRCDNCESQWPADQLGEIDDFFERVDTDAGRLSLMPSGECPECRCLCYPVDAPTTSEVRDFLARLLRGEGTREEIREEALDLAERLERYR